MKLYKSIHNSSTIVCAFLDSDFPSPVFSNVVEQVKSLSEQFSSPSKIYVKSNSKFNNAEWFGKIFEGVIFENTDSDNTIDIVESLKKYYNNVTVVDIKEKEPLLEDYNFQPTGKVVVEIPKNYKGFVNLFEDYLSSSEIRNLYQIYNPPVSYKAIRTDIQSIREQFYQGNVFSVGSFVKNQKNEILEILGRGSNYLVTVNESGDVTREFPKNLVITENSIDYTGYFKGYQVSEEFLELDEIKEAFDSTIDSYNNGEISDSFAILRSIKMVDAYILGEDIDVLSLYKSLQNINVLDKHTYLTNIVENKEYELQAANLIASTFNNTITSNNPIEIINKTIQKVKSKNNKQQIAMLTKMLSTIESLGIKYNRSLLESTEDEFLELHKDQKLLKEKPTKDVLKDHQNLRKLGVDYEARDVGGKREMIKDILGHKHGANKLKSYKSLKAKIRQTLGDELEETTAYGSARAGEHDFAMRGAAKKAQYHLINRKTNQIVSTHPSSLDAVRNRSRIKGTHDTHSIVKEDCDTSNEYDINYEEELKILGYEDLKKNLRKISGIRDEQNLDNFHRIGVSYQHDSNTLRKMKVASAQGH
jgi:hypothetical protein